ncbi:MAG: succinate dehydrogenase, cytochrome b556 subunit [Actinobacteria bacterium]|nr:succinate dehydrogenase, cytochrome b556 subunit [Actinomycetota bacterium]MBW3641659.1 succinate dehydrogenase, cytochrome b556 subunit [Actinomycetota bacterium]
MSAGPDLAPAVRAAPAGTVYRGRSGQWAFIGHRISGVLVFLFLLLHIVDVSLINIDPHLYDEVHELYGNVVLRLFEVGLLFALVFHALNGIRIVMVDLFPGAVRRERRLLAAVVFLTLATCIPGGYVILLPFIEGTLTG